MLARSRRSVPAGHPLRQLFDRLTTRGLEQVGLSDRVIAAYLSDMLVRFVHIDELYRFRDLQGARVAYLVDMIQQAEQCDPAARAEAHRHIGDFTLFLLGFYPESLGVGRKPLGPDYCAEQGRRGYWRAAEMSSGVHAERASAPTLRAFRDLHDGRPLDPTVLPRSLLSIHAPTIRVDIGSNL